MDNFLVINRLDNAVQGTGPPQGSVMNPAPSQSGNDPKLDPSQPFPANQTAAPGAIRTDIISGGRVINVSGNGYQLDIKPEAGEIVILPAGENSTVVDSRHAILYKDPNGSPLFDWKSLGAIGIDGGSIEFVDGALKVIMPDKTYIYYVDSNSNPKFIIGDNARYMYVTYDISNDSFEPATPDEEATSPWRYVIYSATPNPRGAWQPTDIEDIDPDQGNDAQLNACLQYTNESDNINAIACTGVDGEGSGFLVTGEFNF